MIDPDKTNNADPNAVAECAMAVVDAVQTRPAHVRALGIGAALLLVMQKLHLQPQDVMTVTNNIMVGPDGKRVPEFRALALYIENEDIR